MCKHKCSCFGPCMWDCDAEYGFVFARCNCTSALHLKCRAQHLFTLTEGWLSSLLCYKSVLSLTRTWSKLWMLFARDRWSVCNYWYCLLCWPTTLCWMMGTSGSHLDIKAGLVMRGWWRVHNPSGYSSPHLSPMWMTSVLLYFCFPTHAYYVK